MKTSTKILLVLYFLTLIGMLITFSIFINSISINDNAFSIEPSTITYINIATMILNQVFATILYIRFIKSRSYGAMLFFSIVPTTIGFAITTFFISTINNYKNKAVGFVKSLMNISENNSNSYIWVIILTFAYLIFMYITFRILARPVKKIHKTTIRLADGCVKDKINIGKGKFFKDIEVALTKINDNYKQKDAFIKQSNIEMEKFIPKQFLKFWGKKSILELNIGEKLTKEATTMFCSIKNTSSITTNMSLEENFNYINSYINLISPLIKKYNGFIDKCIGDGIVAVFPTPQNAFNCAHIILKNIENKNNKNLNLPKLEVGISLNTADIVFGVVGDESNKNLNIISSSTNFVNKMQEINTKFGSKIIFTTNTLKEISSSSIAYRYIGNLKNERKEYVEIFESIEPYSTFQKEKLLRNKNTFEQAVKIYNNAKYSQAKKLFEKVFKSEKEDKVCYTYYNKCIEKE